MRDYWSITNLGHGLKRNFIIDSELLNHLRNVSSRAFRYTQLKQKISTDFVAFQFPTRKFVFVSLSFEITQLIGAGLAERHIQEYTSHRENLRRHDSPIVLTSDHLEVSFLVLIGFSFFFLPSGEFLPTRRLFQNKTKNLLLACGCF